MKRCPYCQQRTSSAGRLCAHCGRDLGAKVAARVHHVVTCPRCDQTCEAVELGPVEVDRCPGCRGLWLDRGELRELQDLASVDSLKDGIAEFLALVGEQKPPEAVTRLNCPVCKLQMARRNFEDVTGLIIDLCREHGTWLDAAEAKRIFELSMSGDLEAIKSRRDQRRKHEAERHVAHAGEELRTLGNEVAGLRRRHFWHSILDMFD